MQPVNTFKTYLTTPSVLCSNPSVDIEDDSPPPPRSFSQSISGKTSMVSIIWYRTGGE